MGIRAPLDKRGGSKAPLIDRTIGEDYHKVAIVAGAIDDVKAVADNLPAIQAAPEHAQEAALNAGLAQQYAEQAGQSTQLPYDPVLSFENAIA